MSVTARSMIFLYFKIHLHIYLSLLNVFFVFTHEMNYQLLIIIFLINIMIIFFSVQLVMSVRTIWTSPSPSPLTCHSAAHMLSCIFPRNGTVTLRGH